MTRTCALAVAIAVAFTISPALRAQPSGGRTNAPIDPRSAGPASLSELFGRGRTERLVRSGDVDDRLRGIERAAAARTPEGLALLVRCKDDSECAGGDSRALLAVVRGLAVWVERPAARAALVSIVRAPAAVLSGRAQGGAVDPVDERERAERIVLARDEAALALAASRTPDAVKSLWDAVRDSDVGQAAAAQALEAYPPETPIPLSDSPSPATLHLVGAIGDLRSIGAVLNATRASDPAVRAAAVVTLAALGDPRAAEAARAWMHDPEAPVRIASADARVQLGDPDAARAIEELVAADETAGAGLRLAQRVQDDGLTKAAAARTLASADLPLRIEAVSVLARQTTPLALQALGALLADPVLGGAAACGLARSPSPGAMRAIEDAGAREATRRLAARAYFVRRAVRGDRSPRLEALLDRLAHSGDAADRAVATQARVTFDEMPLEAAWRDSDARVRRAAVLGAMGRPDATTAASLIRRLAVEPDRITRIVLAGGLVHGQSGVVLSTSELSQRVAAGQADAPLAAFALARRAGDAASARLDELLASRDPLVKSHALRGLGASDVPDAASRLVSAYASETSRDVRRAAIEALVMHENRAAAGGRSATLAQAASVDPDPRIRATARRALARVHGSPSHDRQEVAWMELVRADDATVPRDVTGIVVTSDGVGIPVAFDDDGFALLPGVAPGDASLRLAASLPPYSSESP